MIDFRLTENDKAYIFLMDYPNRRRIKIWGRARVVEDPELMLQLADQDYGGMPEQVILFEISAWDVNCPQHITPRHTESDIDKIVEPLKRRIEELEGHLQTYQGENP